MIPVVPSLPIKWVVVAILVIAAAFGAKYIDWKLDSQAKTIESQKDQIADLNAQLAFEFVTRKVTTEYVDRIKVIEGKTKTIIKEVPVYVTAEADARCTVPVGFVRLHNAAAQGVPPSGPAGTADAAAADVALSSVAEVVADNYGTCHQLREQVIGLQQWIEETQVANPSIR